MTPTKFILEGQIAGIQEKKYNDEVSHFVQFIIQDGDEGIKLVDVKLSEDDKPMYKAGQFVRAEVSVSGGAQYKVYIKALAPLKVAQPQQSQDKQ